MGCKQLVLQGHKQSTKEVFWVLHCSDYTFSTLICLFNPIIWWLYSADFSISFIPQSIILNPPSEAGGGAMNAHWVVSPVQMYSDQLYTVSMDVWLDNLRPTVSRVCVCVSVWAHRINIPNNRGVCSLNADLINVVSFQSKFNLLGFQNKQIVDLTDFVLQSVECVLACLYLCVWQQIAWRSLDLLFSWVNTV